MSEAHPHTETLAILGEPFTLHFANGATEAVHIRTLPIREYASAFPLYDSEIAFVAAVVTPAKGRALSRDWVSDLTPECYDALAVRAREVNQRFFSYAVRRLRDAAAAMGNLPAAPR